MPRYIALLRGVNVGKAKRVPMAEFKALLEALGCQDVKTLLNSGNAVFGSPARNAAALSGAIAKSLQVRLGVSTPVIVKSAAQWSAIVNNNPNVPDEGEQSRSFVALAPDEATLQGLESLAPLAQASERFVITREAAYLHCPDGVLQSKLGAALLGKLGRAITTRNWATVLKLAALAGASD